MLDLLDRLQEEPDHVILHLSSGQRRLGMVHGIVWEDDGTGWETIKSIYFQPYGSDEYEIFREGEIESYEVVCKEDLPRAAW